MAVAAVPVLMLAVSAIGTGLSTYSSVEQGEQQKRAADYQAKVIKQQAIEAQQQAGLQVAAQDERATRQLAAIRATAAASGISPSEGSAHELFTANQEQAELNDMYTRYSGNLQAQGLLAQANLEEYGGKQAKVASYYNASSNVFSGLGTMGATVMKYPSSFGF